MTIIEDKKMRGKAVMPVSIETIMNTIAKIVERKRGNEFNLEIAEGRDENYYGTTFEKHTPAWRTRIQLTIYEPLKDNEEILGKIFAIGHKLTTHDNGKQA